MGAGNQRTVDQGVMRVQSVYVKECCHQLWRQVEPHAGCKQQGDPKPRIGHPSEEEGEGAKARH